jgi:hypothetical protein
MLLLSLQGTLRQWVAVGVLSSVKWVPLRISQGVPVIPALVSAFNTWFLSCCLAAGLEVWQRTSYLHKQRRSERQGLQQGGSHSTPASNRVPAGISTKHPSSGGSMNEQ